MFQTGSKYLGQTIQGWKVVDRKTTTYKTCQGTHATFVLKKKKGTKIYTMTLSDREMTMITKHGKSIEATIKGKASKACQEYLHRVEQNTIYVDKKFSNLFKRI